MARYERKKGSNERVLKFRTRKPGAAVVAKDLPDDVGTVTAKEAQPTRKAAKKDGE